MSISNLLTDQRKAYLNLNINSLDLAQINSAERLALPQVNGTIVYDNQINNSGATGGFMFFQDGNWDLLKSTNAGNIFLSANLTNTETSLSGQTLNIGSTAGFTLDFISGDILFGLNGVITFNVAGKYYVTYKIRINTIPPNNVGMSGLINFLLISDDNVIKYFANSQSSNTGNNIILSNQTLIITGMINVVKGSTLKGTIFQSTGNSLPIEGLGVNGPETYVNVFYLGP